jgi:hypothetical protein
MDGVNCFGGEARGFFLAPFCYSGVVLPECRRVGWCRLPPVTIRDFFLENFAGDLEYHPRRGVLYLSLAICAALGWIFSSHEAKFTAIPLLFSLGSLTLLVKGIYLFRKSSEGLGLSQPQLAERSHFSARKSLPSIPEQAAQVVQDFGTGPFLLWPLLKLGSDIDPSWNDPPRFAVFFSGAVLFGLGWVIRRFTATA